MKITRKFGVFPALQFNENTHLVWGFSKSHWDVICRRSWGWAVNLGKLTLYHEYAKQS